MGDEILFGTLTRFEQTPRRRGKPTPIEDDRLFPRRDRLLGTLEYHWAEIGWELKEALTLPAIREALRPIPEPRRDDFELFLYEPTQLATPGEFSVKLRAQRALWRNERSAVADLAESRERWERVEGALKNSPEDHRLKTLCDERQASHASVVRRLDNISRERSEIGEQIRQQGAHIAQSALLGFIISDRYSHNPLSMANAMAGVPFIAWRTSATRCEKREPSHSFPLQYELFQEVERALKIPSPRLMKKTVSQVPEQAPETPPPLTTEQAVNQVKEYLLRSTPQTKHSIRQLKDEWYFLRCAIESTYPNTQEMDALPYRVFAEYQRRASSRSQHDLVMMEEDRL